jgi:hypothetical protein
MGFYRHVNHRPCDGRTPRWLTMSQAVGICPYCFSPDDLGTIPMLRRLGFKFAEGVA